MRRVVLALLLSGCAVSTALTAPTTHRYVYPSPELSATERSALEGALASWSTATAFSFEVMDGDPPFHLGPNDVEIVSWTQSRVTDLGACGLTQQIGAGYVIAVAGAYDRTIPPARVQQILTHEIGHALRLEHVADYPSVMAPTLTDRNAVSTPSPGDIARFEILWSSS